MQENEKLEIRSEEVQEILGTPPGWLTRWGTIIAFATLVLLGWAGYWIRYPDTVLAKIRVTSTDPPKKLITERTAYIERILVANEDTVEAGQVLVVFKNQAKFQDVLVLEDYLMSVEEIEDSSLLALDLPRDLLLGDLQEDLYDFFEKQDQLAFLTSRRYEKLNIRQLDRQIQKLQSNIDSEWSRQRKLDQQLELVNERFAKEKKEQEQGLLPLSTLRKTQEEILALERERQAIEASIKNSRYEIDAIKGQISGVRRGSVEDEYSAATQLKESFVKLKSQVQSWSKNNLITSPIRGIVIFTNENLGEEQFVSRETQLMVVVPARETDIVGYLSLDPTGSGKVKEGQRVVVKFDSYPFAEFGAVIGRVSWKGRIPNNNGIPIQIRFPEGLVTTTGREIEPAQEMLGTAEIITVDKRFIERIFENFRRVTS